MKYKFNNVMIKEIFLILFADLPMKSERHQGDHLGFLNNTAK